MEENQEILFAKTLEKVKRLAREQCNSIRKEQVEEAFQVLALSKEQLAMVFEYLEKYHITIVESAAEEEDILSEEEIDYLEEYKKELLELPVFSDGEKDAFTLSAMAGETDAQGGGDRKALCGAGCFCGGSDRRRQRGTFHGCDHAWMPRKEGRGRRNADENGHGCHGGFYQ